DGVYIRDYVGDTGSDNNKDRNVPAPLTPFWDSPDIWIRTKGQDNWVHVRVWNNGSQHSHEVTVNLYQTSFVGTEFLYPEDWRVEDLIGSIVIKGPVGIRANKHRTVKFLLPHKTIPSMLWDSCFLVEILPIHRVKRKLRHVWDDRRIAQKNIILIDWNEKT